MVYLGICKFRCTVLADLAKTEIVELIILLKINGNKKDENSVVNIKEKISVSFLQNSNPSLIVVTEIISTFSEGHGIMERRIGLFTI